MQPAKRRVPSPSLVVACLALMVALGGTAYAASKLPKNSVGAKQLQANAVTSAKVKDGSLQSTDFKKGDAPRGPKGEPGPKGDVGPKGDAGPAGPPGAPNPNADTLDGLDSKAFSRILPVANLSFTSTSQLELDVNGYARVWLACKTSTVALNFQNRMGIDAIESGVVIANEFPLDLPPEIFPIDGISEGSVGSSEYGTQGARISGTFQLSAPGTQKSITVQFGAQNNGSSCSGNMTGFIAG
jgi:hypothetical protein